VSVLIFLITLGLGWSLGIFRALRRRPRFKLALLPGPTACSTFETGQKHGAFEVHRTAIALYLKISNIGSAASSIASVQVGFHWDLTGPSWQWVRYRLGWSWIKHPTITMADFQCKIGEDLKVYPSLLQGTTILGKTTEAFLESGRQVSGVVYFEGADAYGACYPRPRNEHTKVRVAVVDVFGRKHKKSFWIPVLSLAEARKYNPSFGRTVAALRSNAATSKA
jgi:hypothetical protein